MTTPRFIESRCRIVRRGPARNNIIQDGGIVKLIASITLSSLACGFFAGLCFSDGWAWFGLVVVALIGWQWIAAEMMIADLTTREEEI